MSLRLRLTVLLGFIFSVALAVAVVALVHNARQAVVEELQGSTDLASALTRSLASGRAQPPGAGLVADVLSQLDEGAPLRHLRIVAGSAAESAGAGAHPAPESVPAWFFHLVRPRPGSLTRQVGTGADALLIVADPAAEIAEAWQDLRVTLAILLLTFTGAAVVLFLSLGRALKPLTDLSSALEGVERGHYALRLAPSEISDFAIIDERFNQMAAALEASERDNTRLARRSLAIQEEERRHLAHELHDDMGQSITAIKALAVSIRERADDVIGERAGTIIDVSSEIYARVRQMMTRLHPVALEQLGLTPALEQMIDDWNLRHGETFCRLETRAAPDRLGDEVRIGVYRIVQEALTNIARHARAAEATVVLATDQAGDLLVEIRDDGRGFDERSTRPGLGLRGMRERARAMNGTLEITSGPGRGVFISLHVPLAARVARTETEHA
ncbi:MAG: ATP-binding protein [Gammaproteobacteria bacterium]